MRFKMVLVSIVILTGLFLSAFGLPTSPQSVKWQNTVIPPVTVVVSPAVTLVPATTIVQGTPGSVPVTGEPNPTVWSIILFGLLGLLALAFLVALFSSQPTRDDINRNPPPDV